MKLAQIQFGELERSLGNQVRVGWDFAGKDIGYVLSKLIPLIFTLSGIALLIYLLMGGFKLMTSGGDPKKVEEGKHTITNAFVGFIVIFVAFWIVQILGLVLGLEGVGDVFK